MASERRERIHIAQDGNYQRRQHVVVYSPSTQNVVVSRVSKLLWLITTAIVVLLSFRFILMLIAANPENVFTDFIYSITESLVGPFEGITGTPLFGNGNAVDIAAIFAIVVYILITWGVITLVRILFTAPAIARHQTTVEQDT